MGAAVGDPDFPMFEDDGEGGLTAMHHPFPSPKDMTADELKAAPEEAVPPTPTIWLVTVMKSAAVRCTNLLTRMQQTVFGILGINEHKREKFRLPAGCAEVQYAAACRSGLRS